MTQSVQIRVILANLSNILRDIMEKVLLAESDLVVVAQVLSHADLLLLLDETETEVVIVGCEELELPELTGKISRKHPQISILAIVGNGRACYMCRLPPHWEPLGELSPSGLVRAIKAVGAARR